jgi:dTDP-3-amino-3,4,6-trideoxy-alpha-D-glucose transaminase
MGNRPNLSPIFTVRNEGGEIGVLESTDLFEKGCFKRFYFLHNLQIGSVRGFHAHKELEQIFICMTGGFEVILTDSDLNEFRYSLENRYQQLFVPKGFWRVITALEDDSVLAVIASEKYDEADYIREFSDFISRNKAFE